MSINYETVPSPNYAAYANPGFGAALGQMLQGLPDQYMKGRQQARQIEMQKPILDPKTGQPSQDPAAIIQELQRRGGGEYSEKLLPYIYGNKLLEKNSALQPPSMGGDTPSSSAGPGNVARAPSQPVQPQPQLSSAGTDDKGEQTINSLASEVFGDRDMTAALPRYAAAVDNKLGEPLSADQEQRARVLMQRSKGTMASASPGDAATSGAGASGPQNNGNAAPFMAGGTSGAPAPSGGAAPNAVAQAGGGTANVDAAGGPSVAEKWRASQQAMPADPSTGLPPGYTENTAANWYKYAGQKAQIGNVAAVTGNKALAEQAKSEADHAFDMAKQIRAAIKERASFTNEQKNARDPSVQQSAGMKIAQEHELKSGDALNNGLQASAREFETQLKPHLDAVHGILNDPNFVSGTGVGFQEALNKIRSNQLFQGLPGYDPNAALPNEAIRKVMAASILNQTTALKAEAAEMGGSAGRLFQQQIQLMIDAAQKPENTAPALRYLTELQERMGNHARAMAELASNYEGKYGKGVLDRGFNQVLSKFNSDPKNQIFKPKEIADPRMFAPPVSPPQHTKEDFIAWARKAGLRPGDPVKMPSGNIVPAP